MRLLRTSAEILAGRVGLVALSVAVGLLVARALGPVGQGHYSLTVAVLALVAALVNGGIGLAAVPVVRRAQASIGQVLRAQGLWSGLVTLVVLTAALVATGGAAGRWSARVLGWDRAVALIAGGGACALLACETLSYDLLAMGRLVAGTGASLIRATLQLVLLAALVAAGWLNLTAAVGAFAAAHVAGVALLLGIAQRAARKGAEVAPRSIGTRRLLRALLREGWLGQLSSVSSLLHLRLNLALLAAWHGPAAVGVYSVAMLVGELLWHLPGALSPVLVYSSADPAAECARDRLAARAVRLGLGATAIAALPVAILAGPLLPRLFGAEYAPAAPALRALLPGIVAYAAGAVLAGDFIGRGRPAWNAHASALTLGLNLLAGLLLVPRHGAVGAAWASTLAYTGGAAWMLVRFRQASRLGWRELCGWQRAVS